MIICPVLILLFLAQGCLSTTLVGQQYDPTPPPRSPGRKSTHISEFTDPRTGFNPFLDLEEGQPGGIGRNIEEVTDSVPESDLQLVEGGPEDNFHPRRNWGNNWDVQEDLDKPSSPAFDPGLSPVEADDWTGMMEPSYSRGGRRPFLPELSMSSSTEPYSDIVGDLYVPENPLQKDPEYDDAILQVEDSSIVRENREQQPKKLPVSKNVMISAIITGVAVFVLALLIAVCLWRQKLKLNAAQRRTNFLESGESRIGEKPNGSISLPKK